MTDQSPKIELSDYLHRPDRLNRLESLETHLAGAAALARALRLALDASDLIEDKRNAGALARLASAVADHASATEYIFHKAGEKQ